MVGTRPGAANEFPRPPPETRCPGPEAPQHSRASASACPCRAECDRRIGSGIGHLERVALVEVAGLEPLAEPRRPLAAGAVGERVGHDVPAGGLLDRVVADGRGGPEPLLEVAGLEDLPLLLCVVRPDAGEEVGLELEADGKL